MENNIDKEQLKQITDVAKNLLYGDENNFNNMSQVFAKAGNKGFAQAMATVVVGTLERMGKDLGGLEEEMVLAVALTLVAWVASDVEEMGAIKGLTPDDIQLAIMAVVAKLSKVQQKQMEPDEPQQGQDPMQQGQPQQGQPQMPQGQPQQGVMPQQGAM